MLRSRRTNHNNNHAGHDSGSNLNLGMSYGNSHVEGASQSNISSSNNKSYYAQTNTQSLQSPSQQVKQTLQQGLQGLSSLVPPLETGGGRKKFSTKDHDGYAYGISSSSSSSSTPLVWKGLALVLMLLLTATILAGRANRKALQDLLETYPVQVLQPVLTMDVSSRRLDEKAYHSPKNQWQQWERIVDKELRVAKKQLTSLQTDRAKLANNNNNNHSPQVQQQIQALTMEEDRLQKEADFLQKHYAPESIHAREQAWFAREEAFLDQILWLEEAIRKESLRTILEEYVVLRVCVDALEIEFVGCCCCCGFTNDVPNRFSS